VVRLNFYLVLVMTFVMIFFFASVEYRCVRWAWTGDVYNRKVVCLEWQKVERK